jgi:glycosyltransferase involved in cell wall biosynthesis
MSSASTPSAEKYARDREPLVAVGLPCYNSEKYIAESLDCLLAQTFKDFAIIISDNASTEGTESICRRYVARDPRIRYFRNSTNMGMMPNFNRVFSLSNSKYFKWATADDRWHPEMLAKSVAVLEADPNVVVCYPRVVLIDATGVEIKRYEDELHLQQSDPAQRFLKVMDELRLVNHHLGVLRTDAIRKTSMYGTHVGADVGFVAEMSLYGTFFQLPEHLIFRRFHPDSSSWERKSKEHQARRYHAANAKRAPFNVWRFHLAYFRAVLRGPLNPWKKFKMLIRLVRTLYWDRRSLGEELYHDLPLIWRRKNSAPAK